MSKIAIVFPGQGSQAIGMLSEISHKYSIINETFEEVSNCLGYDLWKVSQEGPESKLNQTEITQALMLTANVALYRLLAQIALPSCNIMAGHSLGEYAALVCAQSLTLIDAAKLVSIRGQLMQQTIGLGEGGMAAIVGLTDTQVIEICQEVSTENNQVTPANFNAIGQVVIAGHSNALNKAISLAENHGARLAKLIPVSVPCHCPLLKKAANLFEPILNNTPFNLPKVQVCSNVDLSFYESVDSIRTLLKHQLYKPVRWVEIIQKMVENGITDIIECGPGKVLTGLTKRIDKSLTTYCTQDISSLEVIISKLINK